MTLTVVDLIDEHACGELQQEQRFLAFPVAAPGKSVDKALLDMGMAAYKRKLTNVREFENK